MNSFSIAYRSNPLAQLDLAIAPIGFEQRCAKSLDAFGKRAARRIALRFRDRNELSFGENMIAAVRNKFEVLDYDAATFPQWWKSQLATTIREIADATGPRSPVATIGIDVSSMTRPMIGQIILGLATAQLDVDCHVEFTYSPAPFYPPTNIEGPVTFSGPVLREFAGWDFDRGPLNILVGLGYELGSVDGVLEQLEQSRIFGFKPTGVDRAYDQALDSLVRSKPSFAAARTQPYSVLHPEQLYASLDSLTNALLSAHDRVLIVPFGPKIFSVVSFLIALAFYPKVTIWRISAETHGVAEQRPPSDLTVLLPVSFSRAAKPT